MGSDFMIQSVRATSEEESLQPQLNAAVAVALRVASDKSSSLTKSVV